MSESGQQKSGKVSTTALAEAPSEKLLEIVEGTLETQNPLNEPEKEDSQTPIAAAPGLDQQCEIEYVENADSAPKRLELQNELAPVGESVIALPRADKKGAGRYSFSKAVKNVESYFETKMGWLWSIRAPLFVLSTIALVPKLVILWILVVLAKPISVWLYDHCPEPWKAKLRLSLPQALENSSFLKELNEGADQALPFILFWLYLCLAPFAITWMMLHWVRDLFHSRLPEPKSKNSFVFTQNKRLDKDHSENNFYSSRVFGIVFFAFFVLGIPAFFSYAIYENLGIERLMNDGKSATVIFMDNPSQLPEVPITQVGLKGRRSVAHVDAIQAADITTNRLDSAPTSDEAAVIQGYNGYWPWLRDLGVEPNKASVFFVHFYLVSVASAICILFFRAWFTFPLNFVSDEHDIEFTESGIKRKSLNSWFFSVLTYNRWAVGGGTDSLAWSEVKSLSHLEEGFTKLCPLPETVFKKESLSYKLLNKLAAFIDGLSNQVNTGNFLSFSSTANQDFGRDIKINLNDLNREQRAKLFYAVKKWAPHVIVNKSAEEQMLGSTVLQDNRYTQLWFDMLTSRTQARRQHMLAAGEVLKGGEYTIDERISSGGQATAYLGHKASGEKLVLKEFILATTTMSSGALLESAREFEAEVSLLSQLSHPGIVRLEDFFSEDGRVYVVLEHIQGQSLRQKVQQSGPLSESETVVLAQSICNVLEYLHEQNPPIVHRDITPENILVQQDGTIKLIDFSLAIQHDGRQPTESCAKQCFTPPEQFREEVTPQSDIYALGATIYYMLTGVIPKPITVSSPREKASDVSTEMNHIVELATQLDLSKRYESVKWLKLELANFSEKADHLSSPAKTPPAKHPGKH